MIKLIVIISILVCIAVMAVVYACMVLSDKISRLEESIQYDNFNT